MESWRHKAALWAFVLTCVTACGDYHGQRKMNVSAPLPPDTTSIAMVNLDTVEPATGANIALANAEKTSCGFSSFHRKHTVGYEIDESRHVAFKASPSFDVWNPSDFEMKFSLRFTKALGGPANKRPDCTFGSGYYGLLPYVSNKDINLGGVTNPTSIKSFIEQKLDEREERRAKRENNQDFEI